MDFSVYSIPEEEAYKNMIKAHENGDVIASKNVIVNKPENESILMVVSAGSDVTIHTNQKMTIKIKAK